MNVTKDAAGNRSRRKLVLGAGFISTALLASVVTLTARADEAWYDPAALQTSCTEEVDGLGQADRCRFEPATHENFTGNITRVSGDTVNCTDVNATKSIIWSHATTEENSISVAVKVEAKLSEIFSASITTTYGHSWSYTNTETNTETAPVPAKSVAWIERGAPMQRVTGRMVINYPKRRYGHYEWYTYPTITTSDPQALDFSTVILRTRPATAEELSRLCGIQASTQDTGVEVPPEASTPLRTAKGPETQTTGGFDASQQAASD